MKKFKVAFRIVPGNDLTDLTVSIMAGSLYKAGFAASKMMHQLGFNDTQWTASIEEVEVPCSSVILDSVFG